MELIEEQPLLLCYVNEYAGSCLKNVLSDLKFISW